MHLPQEFMNSVDLTNKIFAMSLILMVFILTTCFIVVTLLLSYQHCRRHSTQPTNTRQRKPTPEFVRWVQKSLNSRGGHVRRHRSGASIFRNSRFDANITELRHEGDVNRWAEATFQEDNVLEDLEFYEIRSDLDSVDFGQDLNVKLKWEETLKTRVLRAPTARNNYSTINRKLAWHSNVRRNLLDEFENAGLNIITV